MKTLAEILAATTAKMSEARTISNQINNLMFAPVGTPEQEAAATAQILALKQQLSNR